MKWLKPDVLCSFDELVRIEIGPQIIELKCTDANLDDTVTHPKYCIGGRDAYGRIIRYNEMAEEDQKKIDARLGVVAKGKKMAVVDWGAKHVPHVWKIYTWDGEKFIKFGERAEVDDAIAFAKELRAEMS